MATVDVKKQTQFTMVQAIRSALIDEMTRDQDVVILGEDIGTLVDDGGFTDGR